MKKLTALFLVFAVLGAVFPFGAAAFDFPEPDWGQLLREKEAMVLATDFELYVEGDVTAAPYYGARLEPRGGTYLGMVAENSDGFAPLGSYLTYIYDMTQDDLYYPANEMVKNGNKAVMVGWTIENMDNVDFGKMRSVLDTLNSYGKPMYIRFANEMNVSALGNDPEKYKSVFRMAADMIHEYPNFAVVWAPNDLGGLDRPFEYFYPGDEYVDWVGVSCYSIRYFQGSPSTTRNESVYFMSGDYAWATNRLKPMLEFMAKNNINKPIMISEGGVATGNSYGDNLQSWATPRFRNMLWSVAMKYPQVKMINYFNKNMPNEIEKFDISGLSYATEIFNEAASSGAYIDGIGGSPRFVYQTANAGAVLQAQNSIVNLYTLAYIPHMPDIVVNYSVDGNWYHSASQIPYTCRLDLSGMADGWHTLNISSAGNSKDYMFYKLGSAIRFGAEITQAEAPIKVMLGGSYLDFDQPPVMRNDRTLVPLRRIFEALGAKVDWNDETQTVTATRGATQIRLTIGSNQMYVNGTAKLIDVPAMLISDRTMVPTRAVSEALGCTVDWDNDTQTVIISE